MMKLQRKLMETVSINDILNVIGSDLIQHEKGVRSVSDKENFV